MSFVGFQERIQPYLVNSKLIVMASDMEGLTFVLIEVMASGLVSILTPVGTIRDLVTHGENGLLFPQGDHQAFAECITSLLVDEDRYLRLRAAAIKVRQSHSFAAATAVWDEWFTSLDGKPA